MQVQSFADHKINSFETYNESTKSWVAVKGLTEFWRTRECSTRLPSGVNIGRVDHFKAKSLKKLVQSCIRKVIEREGQTGEHIITITMADPWDFNLNVSRAVPLRKTIQIKVTV